MLIYWFFILGYLGNRLTGALITRGRLQLYKLCQEISLRLFNHIGTFKKQRYMKKSAYCLKMTYLTAVLKDI